LPGLIAAEQGIDEADRGGKRGSRRDELDEEQPVLAEGTGVGDSPALAGGAGALTIVGETGLTTSEGLGATVVPGTVPLVPDARPRGSITDRVLALFAEVEAVTGPRLELSLIRAQLATSADVNVGDDLAQELASKFPDALAARVAAARLALAKGDDKSVRQALDILAGERGTLAWALRGRWQCTNCSHRPGDFSWRCGQCRRWGTLHMETGIEPPKAAPRDRRASPRGTRDEGAVRGLLGATPAHGLPIPTLDPGLTEDELARGGTRRSLLGRVGGWFSGVWRRGA
jgi:hypothetical protein